MTVSFPTLDSIGWVSTPEETGDRALSYFITSEYSQSVLYHGNIVSLQYLVKKHGHDELTLQSEIATTLDGYLKRYFGENVSVDVRVLEADPQKPGQLTIHLSCIIRGENGLEYSLGRRVIYLNGKLVKIAELNNG